MRSRPAPAARLVALALAGAAAALAQGPPELERNPFDRPVVYRGDAATEDEPAPGEPRELGLRATLVAGSGSLVDVDGQIVGLGDEVHGYRLTAVGEGEATFTREGRRVVVSLTDTLEEEDRDE